MAVNFKLLWLLCYIANTFLSYQKATYNFTFYFIYFFSEKEYDKLRLISCFKCIFMINTGIPIRSLLCIELNEEIMKKLLLLNEFLKPFESKQWEL